MLLTVGARGYEKATVQEVAGAQRHHPRPVPPPLRQQGRVLRAGLRGGGRPALRGPAGGGPRSRRAGALGFRAALAELLRTVAEQPLLAKALLIEVRAARGLAWAAHQRVVERLIAAVDSARSEPDALASASPMTAGFMVGAIEESIGLEIGAGRAAEVERLLPDLSHLVVLNYFGEDEAWLELRSTDTAARLGRRVSIPHRLFKKSCVNGWVVSGCTARCWPNIGEARVCTAAPAARTATQVALTPPP